ncbi:MAG: HD domain-containing protein [Thermogladius sp.]
MSLSGLSWKEISDPIYGHVYYNKEIEERVLGTLPVQRLRYILQLQTAHLVYPGAVHTRFQHSIGVMHLAGVMAEDVLRKLVRFVGPEALAGYSVDELVEAGRLAGLLHDIGHGPFGHTFEEAVLWRGGVSPEVANHERVGLLVYRHTLKDLVDDLGKKSGFSDLAGVVEELLGPGEPRTPVLRLVRRVIKDSYYPADVLDFLRRDSYYAGTGEYGSINHEKLVKNTYPNPRDVSELVLERGGLGEFKAYMTAKASMYHHVYYHSVARAFDRILYDILVLLDEELGLRSAVNAVARGEVRDFLLLTDAGLYDLMLRESVREGSRLGQLARALLVERKPSWKRVGREVVVTPFKRGWSTLKVLRLAYDKSIRERVRRELEEELAGAVGLAREDIWVDVVDITPLPRSVIYSLKGEPLIALGTCEVSGNRIVLDNPLDLVAEGLPLTVLVRGYVRREKYSMDYEPRFSAVVNDYLEELAGEIPESAVDLEAYQHMKITS